MSDANKTPSTEERKIRQALFRIGNALKEIKEIPDLFEVDIKSTNHILQAEVSLMKAEAILDKKGGAE